MLNLVRSLEVNRGGRDSPFSLCPSGPGDGGGSLTHSAPLSLSQSVKRQSSHRTSDLFSTTWNWGKESLGGVNLPSEH